MKRQIHPRSGSHQLESRCGLLLETEFTQDAESTNASDAKYNIISQRLELTLFIIWLTSSSSTAGMEVRVQSGALPAVGCSVLFALFVVCLWRSNWLSELTTDVTVSQRKSNRKQDTDQTKKRLSSRYVLIEQVTVEGWPSAGDALAINNTRTSLMDKPSLCDIAPIRYQGHPNHHAGIGRIPSPCDHGND
jgi:hypothetical protein